jgi:hypothetical protein
VLLVAGFVIGVLGVLLWFATQTAVTYESYEQCLLDKTRGQAPGAIIWADPLCSSFPKRGN